MPIAFLGLGTVEWLIVLTLLIPPAIIGTVAAKKNRSGLLWGLPALLPVLWIPLGICVAFISHLCPTCRRPLSADEKRRGECPRCG